MGANRSLRLGRGALLLVSLDPTVGHEQRGLRPCIVVSDPDLNNDQRYPLLCVIPITRTPGRGALYPPLDARPKGLRAPSWALVDQVRTIDKRRVRRIFGSISEDELAAVDGGLELLLGLGGRASP